MNTHIKFDSSFSHACVKACQKILSQITKARNNVLAQFRGLAEDHQRVLQLAINEAEALAWETTYPELVFLDLAEEKAHGVVNWIEHQKEVRSGVLV